MADPIPKKPTTTSGPRQTALKKKVDINSQGPIGAARTRAEKQKSMLDEIFHQDHSGKKQH